jgi:YVTN family beta-propeller protein
MWPDAIAITPDGATAYVANFGSGTVTPIDTATNTAGPAIAVGKGPDDIAITPDGATAYVADANAGTVTPVSIASGKAGPAIKVGGFPDDIAITPNGKSAYVTIITAKNSVVPIQTATNTAGKPIKGPKSASVIVIAGNGKTAYVNGSVPAGPDFDSFLTPIKIPANTAGKAIQFGVHTDVSDLELVPGGKTAYVVIFVLLPGFAGSATALNMATGTFGRSAAVGSRPFSIAFTP